MLWNKDKKKSMAVSAHTNNDPRDLMVTMPSVEDPNAILDLTVLLTTGRAPDSLSDFLGSGEQMTDRVSASLAFLKHR